MTKTEWLNSNEFTSERDRSLAERAHDTIMGNVYPTEGYRWCPYRCTSPGRNTFFGIWNWDSAFHAIGISRWDSALAKENVLGFMQFQKENGLLPDVIFENGEIVDTFTKPPVFAWACETLYRRDGDISFLEKVYPMLVLNEKWWIENRLDRGLFYYDADGKNTEDYLTRVRYESGWDNAVRWDTGITEYWAVDLNCFMVMTYRSLAFIAGELGLPRDAQRWQARAEQTGALVNERLWDGERGYYSDALRESGEVSTVLSPASFMPLYVGIATEEQAKAMALVAERNFEKKMPTVSFDNPEYSNDYWRGPTWLNVAYFAAKGLKNYGLGVADEIKENILNMCDAEKSGVYENYDSRTGKGLCCNQFSWSSVFIIEFILNW